MPGGGILVWTAAYEISDSLIFGLAKFGKGRFQY